MLINAFKRIVVEKAKDCWDICDKKKKCVIAQMDEQANECSLFKKKQVFDEILVIQTGRI